MYRWAIFASGISSGTGAVWGCGTGVDDTKEHSEEARDGDDLQCQKSEGQQQHTDDNGPAYDQGQQQHTDDNGPAYDPNIPSFDNVQI